MMRILCITLFLLFNINSGIVYAKEITFSQTIIPLSKIEYKRLYELYKNAKRNSEEKHIVKSYTFNHSYLHSLIILHSYKNQSQQAPDFKVIAIYQSILTKKTMVLEPG